MTLPGLNAIPEGILKYFPKVSRGLCSTKRRAALFAPCLLDPYGKQHCGLSLGTAVRFKKQRPRETLCKDPFGKIRKATRCIKFNECHNNMLQTLDGCCFGLVKR